MVREPMEQSCSRYFIARAELRGGGGVHCLPTVGVIGSVAVGLRRWAEDSHGRHSIAPTVAAVSNPSVVIHGVFFENKETTPLSEAKENAASYRNKDPSRVALFGLVARMSIRESIFPLARRLHYGICCRIQVLSH